MTEPRPALDRPAVGTPSSPAPQGGRLSRSGLIAAASAYGLWGLLPLYFIALAPAGPVEIVGWRIVFSLLLCVVLLTLARSWGRVIAVIRRPRLIFTLGAAGALIFVNWLVYVLAALDGQVIEASLGYFINPIVTVLLGVLVLKERLRPLQWGAIGISAVAVLVLAVGHGSFPWIAIALALSFGFYGLLKKRLGPDVDALTGFTLETAWLLVPAVGMLGAVAASGALAFGTAGPVNALLLAAAGPVTAIPLLLFAAAARRLPLTVLGFVQYLAPLSQFAIGVAVLHEPMPLERWVGFALVWVALAVLSFDAVRGTRRARVLAVAPSA